MRILNNIKGNMSINNRIYKRNKRRNNIMLKSSQIIGSGLATVGLGGVGTGIVIVFGSLINSTGRNPKVKSQLFNYAILGFALVEAIGLFALMICFLLLFGM